jgi:hypothetical protein
VGGRAWHDILYSGFRDKACVNIPYWSNGDGRRH